MAALLVLYSSGSEAQMVSPLSVVIQSEFYFVCLGMYVFLRVLVNYWSLARMMWLGMWCGLVSSAVLCVNRYLLSAFYVRALTQ